MQQLRSCQNPLSIHEYGVPKAAPVAQMLETGFKQLSRSDFLN